jgi:hypothetical protein
MLIPATATTPLVKYDETDFTLEIIGRSIPEDSLAFYEPVLNLLQDVQEHYPKTLKAVFQLEYVNTHSSRSILDVFRKLDEIRSSGTLAKVFWVCEEDDRDIILQGEDLMSLVNVDMEIIELPEHKYDELMHRAKLQSIDMQ